MPSNKDFAYPQPRDGDDDDVVWALQAGAMEWQRGGNADALVWLRRAIEAANAAGNAFRASEIQAAVDELVEAMWSAGEEGNPLTEALTLQPAELGEDEIEEEALEDLDLEELSDNDLVAEEAWLEEDEVRDSFPELGLAPLTLPADSLEVLTDASGELSGGPLPVDPEFSGAGILGRVEFAEIHEASAQSVTVDDDYALTVSPQAALEKSDTDLEALVASVRSPSVDLGVEPVDDAIATALEIDAPSVASWSKAPPPIPGPSAVVDGVPLGECLGFEDLPEATLVQLAGVVRLEPLHMDEELGAFGAALVTHGAVAVVSEISDEPALLATKGDVVFTEGSLPDGTKLRVVSTLDNTVVALWSAADLEHALNECPWVKEQLQAIADRFQALAGATLGILGERLDASLRRTVTDRMEVRAYAPGEVVFDKGVPIPGLYIVGAGRIELLSDDEGPVSTECLPGDFLFPEGVLSSVPARCLARAGAKGALLLVASRAVAHELVTGVPPLLEALVS